VMAPRTLFL
nr:Chain P, leader peptide of HLA class I histocompatibility antigen, alpha chain G [synthetic construct]3BZE_Q Chain Q, leader peptide of HLA class I histocompatibility antigen, alpha chain G [synthetic construct]3BZE_R Chain R, leader peptide of HLA class I histocompatibility antigen, alpha chain G [synthetic construct]3BZE_S Chain S, leader peptide of HLA class I histocompatibility antigen, alpha chain G [synthetic construct]3CDG_P Chain P, leader peptide of HLA class I histocompatibility an